MKSEIRPFIVHLLGGANWRGRAEMALVSVFIVGAAATHALASAVPTSRSSGMHGSALSSVSVGFPPREEHDIDDFQVPSFSGFGHFNDAANASSNTSGITATAQATQDSSLTLDAQGRLLSVQGSASARATAAIPNLSSEFTVPGAGSNGFSSFLVAFSVSGGYEHSITVTQSVSSNRVPDGQGGFFPAFAQLQFRDIITGTGYSKTQRIPIETGQLTVSEGGSTSGPLPPGDYTLEVRVEAGTRQFALDSSEHGQADTTWQLTLLPPIFWNNAADGVFQTGGNWSGGNPPALGDNAAVDRPGNYTIKLDGDAAHKGLFVNGPGVNVTIDANGFDYVLDEISLGGLDGDSGAVTFADSSDVVVSAASAAAGDGPTPAAASSNPAARLRARLLKASMGYTANVTTPISTNVGTIDNNGRVNVKGANGRWDVVLLNLGEDLEGILEISRGGKVVSDRAVVGTNSSARISTALVTGQGSEWDNQWLIVGERGIGLLEIVDKGIVGGRDIVLGSEAGSRGVINLSNSASLIQNPADKLTIGDAGSGLLEVRGGSRVLAGSLQIAALSGSSGEVVVGADGFLEVFGTLSIGFSNGSATLNVNGGGRVERNDASRFTAIFPNGELIVDDGHFYERNELSLNGALHINRFFGSASVGQSQITTPGKLTIGPGGTLTGYGTIHGDLDVLGGNDEMFVGGVVKPGTSPGTLTIDGDYEQTGGLLGIEIAGTAAGQFDVLKVFGDAAIAGDLELVFINGFAPRQGDAFEFLDVGGALSGSFASIEVRNLAPGFQFDLRPDAGGLTMVALNDGVFVPEPATLAMFFAGMLATVFRRQVR